MALQTNAPTQQVTRAPARPSMSELRGYLDERARELDAVLPADVTAEKFIRTVLTACRREPRLIGADRASFFTACLQAAQDGLLPDGREAVLVIYKGRAQYQSMIAGLRKKVRNSGEIATWDAHVVHENDEFYYELGDEPQIIHRPTLDNPGRPVAVYSIATMKDGGFKSRDVMSASDVERVRSFSNAPDSPAWTKHWEEMAKKTICRRHSKVLPMSTDLEAFVNRPDSHFADQGEDAASGEEERQGRKRNRLQGALEQIARVRPEEAEPAPAHNPDTGEILDDDGGEAPADPNNKDFQRGARDRREGQTKCLNVAIRETPERFEQWKAGFDSVEPDDTASDGITIEGTANE